MRFILLINMILAFAATAVSLAGEVSVVFSSRVQPLGESRLRLERTYDRLCLPPLDDLEFVLSDVNFHQARRFTEYSGDISGRLLGALNAAEPLLGRQTPMLPALTKALGQYQKPDGHFGADQDLAHSINQERDMPILWGNSRLLLALAQRYRQAPSPELLATAKRLGEYIISTRPFYGREENFTQVGGIYASGFTTCYPAWIDGLVALAEVTGQTKFYDEARFIGRLSLLDSEFARHHSHGRLVAYCGLLELDRLTGTSDFQNAALTGAKYIAQNYQFPTGGVPEIFGLTRDEGCSEADWIRLNFLLWRATGQTAYLDAAEGALRNHLWATQFPNGGFGHYDFRTLQDENNSYPGGGIFNWGSDSYWCCSMHAAQVLADVVRWGAFLSDNSLMVTWLSEVHASFHLDELDIAVSAQKLNDSYWRLTLDSPKKASLALRLRVPGWQDALIVNDKKYPAENGWVELPCDWSGKLEWHVRLDDSIRMTDARGKEPRENRPVRILRGPDLYCLPDAGVGPGLFEANSVPTIILSPEKLTQGEIPIVILGLNDKTQRARLVPISQRPPGGCWLLFKVRRVDKERFQEVASAAAAQPEPAAPVTLVFACAKEGEFYLNGNRIFVRGGPSESPQFVYYVNRSFNVLVVKAPGEIDVPGLIGYVQAGGKIYCTNSRDFSVIPCEDKIPDEWLTDPQKMIENLVPLADLGGFGADPFKHLPAQFAGTSARWIWPEKSESLPRPAWWLFRFCFTLPEIEK